MASAKKEAQKMLGKENDYINLKGLNKERSIANDVYNTNTTSFQNAYNDLLNTISTNRGKAKTDFSSGRGAISENAYLQNRNDISNLASRGLNGGLAQLSKLGNRMETGRQFSDLANTYYNTMNELDANEKTYTNEYNTNMETAKNTLNAALADIGSREKAARNAYKAAVAQLAEQIQARRAAQAQAAATRAYYNNLSKQDEKNRLNNINNELINIYKNDGAGKALDFYRNVMGNNKAKWSDLSNYIVNNGLNVDNNVLGFNGLLTHTLLNTLPNAANKSSKKKKK